VRDGSERDGEGHTVRGAVRDGSVRDGEGHTVRGAVRDGSVRDGEGDTVSGAVRGGSVRDGEGHTCAPAVFKPGGTTGAGPWLDRGLGLGGVVVGCASSSRAADALPAALSPWGITCQTPRTPPVRRRHKDARKLQLS
jgi:hypothetical protein